VWEETGGRQMKYKAEIWRYHSIIDTCESDNVKDIIEWFRSEWYGSYDDGMCYLEVYRDGEELSWDEKFALRIID
jgi:hypothetical protein